MVRVSARFELARVRVIESTVCAKPRFHDEVQSMSGMAYSESPTEVVPILFRALVGKHDVGFSSSAVISRELLVN